MRINIQMHSFSGFLSSSFPLYLILLTHTKYLKLHQYTDETDFCRRSSKANDRFFLSLRCFFFDVVCLKLKNASLFESCLHTKQNAKQKGKKSIKITIQWQKLRSAHSFMYHSRDKNERERKKRDTPRINEIENELYPLSVNCDIV